VARVPATLALVAAVVAGLLLVSGGSAADPRTPAGLPGLPPPFLGTAIVGGGGLTAAVDAYGDVVDLRSSPAGPALLTVPAARQAAGTVSPEMAIVPRLRLGDGRMLPFWSADAIAQRYLQGTNVLVTTARFGHLRASVTYAVGRDGLACLTSVTAGGAGRGTAGGGSGISAAHRRAAAVRVHVLPGAIANAGADLPPCESARARAAIAVATRADRRWLAAGAPLDAGAPAWAVRLYQRSLLVLRTLTDRDSGAVAAGARDDWAYVWPRDAATAALAFRAAGHDREARRVARFLGGLDLDAAARFHGDGSPVPGRAAPGDAAGWVAVATRAVAPTAAPSRSRRQGTARGRGRADYQEKTADDYLGNAIAATALEPRAARLAAAERISRSFGDPTGLHRVARSPGSGADSAAAWAVRPFALPGLAPQARISLRRLLASGGPLGIVPSADWPGRDPWTAPTAWSAWAFAALMRADQRAGRAALARTSRRAALTLLADLRRAATPLDTLPERVDFRTGEPRSTTPLAWSHAFAILALGELWPTH
jgi:hypothetical protein